MKRFVIVTTIFLILNPLAFANPDSIRAAKPAASAFLELVDGNKYGQTWNETSSQLQAAVSQSEWIENITNYRSPLGLLKSRNADSAEYHESLPDAAEGEYIIFTYVSSFENRNSAHEIVALAKEPDCSWRVIGYYIE